MEPKFQPLRGEDDVFSIDDGPRIYNDKMFKTGDFLEIINHNLTTNLLSGNGKKWLESGVMCSFLKLGAMKWVKGRIRIKVSLEFCPSEGSILQ